LEPVFAGGVVIERLLLDRAVQIGRCDRRVVEDPDRVGGPPGQVVETRDPAFDARAVGLPTEGIERCPGDVEVTDLQAGVADDGHRAEGAQVALENRLGLGDGLGPLVERDEVDRQAGAGGDVARVELDRLLERCSSEGVLRDVAGLATLLREELSQVLVLRVAGGIGLDPVLPEADPRVRVRGVDQGGRRPGVRSLDLDLGHRVLDADAADRAGPVRRGGRDGGRREAGKAVAQERDGQRGDRDQCESVPGHGPAFRVSGHAPTQTRSPGNGTPGPWCA
jgi:hypothetical protein